MQALERSGRAGESRLIALRARQGTPAHLRGERQPDRRPGRTRCNGAPLVQPPGLDAQTAARTHRRGLATEASSNAAASSRRSWLAVGAAGAAGVAGAAALALQGPPAQAEPAQAPGQAPGACA